MATRTRRSVSSSAASRVECSTARRDLDDRGLRVEIVVLRDHRDAQLASPVDLACIGFFRSGQDPQHRGLAGAVGSDHSDSIALGDRDAQPIEQSSGPERSGDLASGDQRRHGGESIRAVSRCGRPDRMRPSVLGNRPLPCELLQRQIKAAVHSRRVAELKGRFFDPQRPEVIRPSRVAERSAGASARAPSSTADRPGW